MPRASESSRLTPHVVGRERESEQLYEWHERRWGSLLLVTGPAGIGKTTLLTRFSERANSRERPPVVWVEAGTSVEELLSEAQARLREHGRWKVATVVVDNLDALISVPHEVHRLRERMRRRQWERLPDREAFAGMLQWILVSRQLPWPKGDLFRNPPDRFDDRFLRHTWIEGLDMDVSLLQLRGLDEGDLTEMLSRHPDHRTLSTENRRAIAAIACTQWAGNPAHALRLAELVRATGDPSAALRAFSSQGHLVAAPNGDELRVSAATSLGPSDILTPSGIFGLVPHLFIPSVAQAWTAAIGEFQALLNKKGLRESQLQAFFEKHPHFLQGLEYTRIVAHPVLERLDGQGNLIPDFLLQPADTPFADIWDLKLPSVPLIVGTKDRKHFSAKVHEALAQVREYRDYFEDEENRRKIRDRYGLTSYRPNVAIVIGTGTPTLTPEKHKQIHDELPKNARVMTYDQLLAQMQRQVALCRA